MGSLREGYQKILDGAHRSYNVNKICKVLSVMEGTEE
jgi:hypothetical protein